MEHFVRLIDVAEARNYHREKEICEKLLTWLFCVSGRHLFYEKDRRGDDEVFACFGSLEWQFVSEGKNFKLFT
jgi:hypothetical protein